MTKKKTVQVARLAFRREDKWWRCYLARLGTMDGALELASIRMSLVEGDAATKEAFMAAMRSAFTTACRDLGLGTPTFPGPVSAPESERGGNA